MTSNRSKNQSVRRAEDVLIHSDRYVGQLRRILEAQCPVCAGELDREGVCFVCDLKWEAESRGDFLFVSGCTRMADFGGSNVVWRLYDDLGEQLEHKRDKAT